MTKVKPFKAVIYNRNKIKDLSKVVCPPYDVIPPAQQEYYHNLSPYNLIHILLGRDVSGENKYKRSGRFFRDWLKHDVFIQEEKPGIYFYSHQYNLLGEKRIRLGFIALLGLKDKNSAVFGHEHTHLEPKEDRLRLIREVKANLSPIFVTFSDKKRIIQRLYGQYLQNSAPFIELKDKEGSIHKLWRITDKRLLELVEKVMKDENIYIADGHHRYEVASRFRREMKKKEKNKTANKNYNYILAYFANTDPRGLTILPMHRLLKLGPRFDIEAFKNNLKEYFHVEEIKEKSRFFFLLQKGGRTEHVLGMYKERKFWLLRLKNIKILDRMILEKSKDYRALDIAILNHIILEKIAGIDLDDKDKLVFSQNIDELIQSVDANLSYLAFFLNPVKIEQIIAVSLNAERMPPKSTFFYPKVLSGLVINKFDG